MRGEHRRARGHRNRPASFTAEVTWLDGTRNDAWDELWRRILGDVLGPSRDPGERVEGEDDTVEQNPQPPVPEGDI